TEVPRGAVSQARPHSVSLVCLLSGRSIPCGFQHQTAQGKQQNDCFRHEESQALGDQPIDPYTEKPDEDCRRYDRCDQPHAGNKPTCGDETREAEYCKAKWKRPKPDASCGDRQSRVQRGAGGSRGAYRIGDIAQTNRGEDQSCRRQDEPVNPWCKTLETSH